MKRTADTGGEFVMSWADFVRMFDHVCLAIVQPKGWVEASMTGRWQAADKHLWQFCTGGEQVALEVLQDAEVVVQLCATDIDVRVSCDMYMSDRLVALVPSRETQVCVCACVCVCVRACVYLRA